jgi:hypothetical protein
MVHYLNNCHSGIVNIKFINSNFTLGTYVYYIYIVDMNNECNLLQVLPFTE